MILKSHNALWYANRAVLWLNGKSLGSAMVPSDRALATFHRLSVVIMSPSAAVSPQFLMESFQL